MLLRRIFAVVRWISTVVQRTIGAILSSSSIINKFLLAKKINSFLSRISVKHLLDNFRTDNHGFLTGSPAVPRSIPPCGPHPSPPPPRQSQPLQHHRRNGCQVSVASSLFYSDLHQLGVFHVSFIKTAIFIDGICCL